MKTRLYFILSLLSILVLLNSYSYAEKPLSEKAEKIRGIVQYLASDELEGRLAGTEGNKKATEYVLNQFKQIGLLPVANVYTQEFTVRAGVSLSPKNNVVFTKLIEKIGLPQEMWTKANKSWTVGNEWKPISFSDNGTVTGELAFVGWGITAKDINYDDYDGIDVKNKIVIVLSDSLDGKPVESRFESYSTLRYKVSNARDHGAVGVIFVKRLSDSANIFYPLKIERTIKNGGMISIQSTRTEIAKFFPKDRNLYPIELEMRKSKTPNSFVLPNTKVTITVDIDYKMAPALNVLGMVKGTDPAKQNEYIIIGAHFDHLGWGADNSMYHGIKPMIHYGADDNASGTSALIELAAEINARPLKRNVIFIAFNGEELGTLGSSFYVKNPLVPLEQTIAMVNIDMAGRMKDNKLFIFGTGTSSGFSQMVDSLGVLDTLTIVKNSEGYGASDHSPFYGAGLPVLFMFTGAHTDYHTPGDKWDKLNYEGIVKVAGYVDLAVRTLDSKITKPDFIKTGNNPNDNEGKEITEKPKGYGSVWFGVVPNFEENKQGLLISGCSGGSPAEKAGLKNGDIITKIGDRTVKNLYDLSSILKEHQPNDVVTVLFIRNGKDMSTDVKLLKR